VNVRRRGVPSLPPFLARSRFHPVHQGRKVYVRPTLLGEVVPLWGECPVHNLGAARTRKAAEKERLTNVRSVDRGFLTVA